MRQMVERLMASVSMSPSKVATISSNVHRVTVRPLSCGNWLATAMIVTRVREETVRGRPERGASCSPAKPNSWYRRRHLPTVRLEQLRSRPICTLLGVSAAAALKTIRARNASDCGVEWACAKACRFVWRFCDTMMRGAKGVGMGDLLAKRSWESISRLLPISYFHIEISADCL